MKIGLRTPQVEHAKSPGPIYSPSRIGKQPTDIKLLQKRRPIFSDEFEHNEMMGPCVYTPLLKPRDPRFKYRFRENVDLFNLADTAKGCGADQYYDINNFEKLENTSLVKSIGRSGREEIEWNIL